MIVCFAFKRKGIIDGREVTVARLQIHQFPCLNDNYGVLVHDAEADLTAAIDTPEVAPIERALSDKGWRLTHILNTHHHGDHTGGNLELKQNTGCIVVGPAGGQIPGIDQPLSEGDTFAFGAHRAEILATPGHTLDHICYWFKDDGVAFVGDTLFALGCGRVFEGTPPQMWASLQKLMALPRDTTVYCGHEYTLANAKFALTVDPQNDALLARAKKIEKLRADGKPTLPTTIGAELDTNPFLRADDPAVQAHLGLEGRAGAEVFTEIRRRKDVF